MTSLGLRGMILSICTCVTSPRIHFPSKAPFTGLGHLLGLLWGRFLAIAGLPFLALEWKHRVGLKGDAGAMGKWWSGGESLIQMGG